MRRISKRLHYAPVSLSWNGTLESASCRERRQKGRESRSHQCDRCDHRTHKCGRYAASAKIVAMSKIIIAVALVVLLAVFFFVQPAIPARTPSAANIDPNKY